MRVRSTFRRRQFAAAISEPLESRRMLAYSAASYFPLDAGRQWTYTGTLDTSAATLAKIDSTSDTVGLLPVTRLIALVGTGTSFSSGSTYFTHDSAGLKLHQFDYNIDVDASDADTELDATFAAPLKILNASINNGDVINFGSVATTAKIRDNHPAGGGFTNYTITGTTTGTSTVLGLERVVLPDGRFIDALKFTLDLDFNFSGSFSGVSATLTGSDTATYWLGNGIGIVKRAEDGAYNVAAPLLGINQSDTFDTDITLSSSALLPPDSASLVSGVLSLTGTSASDILSLAVSGSKIIASNGAASEEFNFSAVTSINVLGLDGNDSIGIGANVGEVFVDGGIGNDVIVSNPTRTAALNATGAGGNDTIVGGAGDDELSGANGKDRIFGVGGGDYLLGGANNDTLFGGAGDDTCSGAGGKDRVFGDSGADYLLGGAGNDLLDGVFLLEAGADGIDTLSGNAGTDSGVASSNDIVAGIEILA